MERRKFQRADLDIQVWYQTQDDDSISFGKPKARNISSGGIQLEMASPEHVNSNILVKLRLPNYDNEITAHGKIVWTKKADQNNFSVGIQFTKIQESDSAVIQNFIISRN